MPTEPVRTQQQLLAENEDLRARLAEAEETLHAIRSGQVDALMVRGVGGEQLFTLKGADRSYRVLIEEMNEGALTLTMDGVILYANHSFAEMLKTPLENVIGSDIHTWIAPDSQPILQSLLRKGVDENRREELNLTASDGTLVSVSLSASNLLINEIPASFCLVATDLTEQKHSEEIAASESLARELLEASNQSRLALLSVIEDQKRTEEALKKRESYLTAIFENLPGLLWLKDADSRFLFVNQAFIVSCGKTSAEDLFGKTDIDIWPIELAEKYRADDAKVMMNNISVNVEEPIIDRNETKWFETFKTPMRDDQGHVIGTTGFSRDITERKQAEVEIRSQLEELERWQDVMLGRGEREQKLKREVNELCRRAGESARYPSQEIDPDDSESAPEKS